MVQMHFFLQFVGTAELKVQVLQVSFPWKKKKTLNMENLPWLLF